MKTNESPRTRALCQQVQDRGWYYASLAGGSPFQTTSLPDRLFVCCLRDEDGRVTAWHGLIEFKSHAGKLREGQRLAIKEMRRRDPTSAYIVRLGVNIGDPMYVEDENGKALTYVSEENGVMMLRAIMGMLYE